MVLSSVPVYYNAFDRPLVRNELKTLGPSRRDAEPRRLYYCMQRDFWGCSLTSSAVLSWHPFCRATNGPHTMLHCEEAGTPACAGGVEVFYYLVSFGQILSRSNKP